MCLSLFMSTLFIGHKLRNHVHKVINTRLQGTHTFKARLQGIMSRADRQHRLLRDYFLYHLRSEEIKGVSD